MLVPVALYVQKDHTARLVLALPYHAQMRVRIVLPLAALLQSHACAARTLYMFLQAILLVHHADRRSTCRRVLRPAK